jgi:drug/metabolite transporter (DMT)-like permease
MLLRCSYSLTQYLGAFTVALGIAVVLGPSMAHSGGGDSSGSGGGASFGWCAVMILSCVPMALSSVYKEIALGESELDPIYLNGWVAVFQFAVSLPLALPAALAGDPPVGPLALPENIWDGLKCYLGVDSVEGGAHPDHCWPGGPLYVTLYLIFK